MKALTKLLLAAAMAMELAAQADNVTYFDPTDADNPSKTADCIPYDGQTVLTSGWYVVEGTFTNDTRIVISNDVNIILANGAELVAKAGIGVNSYLDIADYDGGEQAFSIWAQSADAAVVGRLTATAAPGDAAIGADATGDGGEIYIYGGRISASGNEGSAGIGGGAAEDGFGGRVYIYGGVVTAVGGAGAAGLGLGWKGSESEVEIYGGEVTAVGTDGGPGIGGDTAYVVIGHQSAFACLVTATGGVGTAGIFACTVEILDDATVDATAGAGYDPASADEEGSFPGFFADEEGPIPGIFAEEVFTIDEGLEIREPPNGYIPDDCTFVVDQDEQIAPHVVIGTPVLHLDEIPSQVYTGSALTPALVVTYLGDALEDADYTVAYATNGVAVAEMRDAGAYTVTVTGTGDYADMSASRIFTVERRPVSVSVVDRTVEYDGSEQTGESECVFTNVVSGHTATITYASATGRVVNTYSGSFGDDFRVTDGNDADVTSNYDLAERTPGTLTIANRTEPYEITVQANSSTNNVYDGTETGVTGFVTLTFVVAGNNYTVSGLETSDPTSKDVCDLVNGISGTAVVKDAFGNIVTEQFAVHTEDGRLMIAPAPLTITARDQTYRFNGLQQGESDPVYADPAQIAEKVEVEGLQGTDTLTSITLEGAETAPGVYGGKIAVTGLMINNDLAAKGNYDIEYVKGTLTILPLAEVTDVEARTVSPWNGLVSLSFNVTNTPSFGLPDWNNPFLSIVATDNATGSNYVSVASALSGQTNAVDGTHDVTWDMGAQGIKFASTNVTFTVAYLILPDYCIIDLSGGTNATSYPVTYVSTVPTVPTVPNVPGGTFNTDAYKTTNLVMRLLAPGTFMMGGTTSTTISNAFYCAIFETTQRQWELVTGANPSYFTNETCYATRPAEQVSWNMLRGDASTYNWPSVKDVDPKSFLGGLRLKTGLSSLDLPTSAQWEYACRAGTTTDFNNGKNWTGNNDTNLNEIARYKSNCGVDNYADPSQDCLTDHGTAAVGSYKPNDWGLYDMHGNVYEWSLDSFGSSRITCGGCWYESADCCSSSFRTIGGPAGGTYYCGSRLVRTLSSNLEAERNPEAVAGAERAGTVCAGVSPQVALEKGRATAFSGMFTLEGRELVAGEFTAGLYDADGHLLQTATNAVDGTFAFEAIEYGLTDIGAHVYTVRQGTGTDVDVLYDSTEYTVSLTVDVGAEGLVANVTGSSSALNFANRMTGGLTVCNVLVSDRPQDRYQAFSFTVKLDDATVSGTYGDVTFTGGVGAFTLKGDEATTIAKLPVGIGYTVAEATVEGFTTFRSGDTGTISTTPSEAKFTNVATPAITDVAATPGAPGSGAVNLTFNVTNSPAAVCPDWNQPYLSIVATDHLTGSNYVSVASALTGDTDATPGPHTVTWKLGDQGIDVTSPNVTFTVAYLNMPDYCVIDLSNGTNATSYAVSYLDAEPASGFTNNLYRTTRLAMRLLAPGTFSMGYADYPDNRPHDVTLTQPFYCAVFETTRMQWMLVNGFHQTAFNGDTRPVEMVSWNMIRGDSSTYNWPDSVAVDPSTFVGKLQARTGLALDLPTEAQWEYACRAGSTNRWSFGDSEDAAGDYMWYADNSTNQTHVVGTKLPNVWGLYDMHGNVFEWCLDWYNADIDGGNDPKGFSFGAYRVLRGGNWGYNMGGCSSSDRDMFNPSGADNSIGFRLVRTLPRNSESERAGEAVAGAERAGTVCAGTSEPIAFGIKEFADTDIKLTDFRGVFDGQIHTIGIHTNAIPGLALNFAVGETGSSGELALPFGAVLPVFTNVCEMTVWVEASAPGYFTATNSATVTILPPPGVTDVAASPDAPRSRKINITFSVTNSPAAVCPDWNQPYLSIVATDHLTGSNYVSVASALTADAAARLGSNGTHEVVWDMAGVLPEGFYSSDMTFTVAYLKMPDYCVIDLSGGTNATSYPVTYVSTVPTVPDIPGGTFNTDAYKTDKLVMRLLAPGTFMMGSANPEDETPQDSVTLTNAFYCAVFETTQRQWELVTGDRPSMFINEAYYATRPVEMVSWNRIRGDAATYNWPSVKDVDPESFLGVLHLKSGLTTLDLPTEAQWEYACRAGTTTDFNNGQNWTGDNIDTNLNEVARYWWNDASPDPDNYVLPNENCETNFGTAAVGSYKPNDWGLYDMHGNVWEWTLNSSGGDRVARGGGWYSGPLCCTSFHWDYDDPSDESYSCGFRLVRTLSYDSESERVGEMVTGAERAGTVCAGTSDQVAVGIKEFAEGDIKLTDYEGEYDGNGHGIGVEATAAIPGLELRHWCEMSPSSPSATLPLFTNVCEATVWVEASAPGYVTATNSATVKIGPRSITNATVVVGDVVFTGVPAQPVPVVTDGDPSIITTNDYTVAYAGNDVPGTGTVTLTGTGNYTGTTEATFRIGVAELSAELGWKSLKATGTYFAQLKVTCTNGLAAGVDDLKFLFADRVGADGKTAAALWRTPLRAANPDTTVYGGATYRYVALDASRITAEGEPVTFGVANLASATIPVAERTIEMYVRTGVSPEGGNAGAAQVDDFVGYVVWTSGGETCAVPVVASGSRAAAPLAAVTARSRGSATLPSVARLNASLAVGVLLTEDSSPYCRLAAFSVEGSVMRGTVEVGADAHAGTLGANATVTVLGAASPAGPFAEISAVAVAADGTFSLAVPPDVAFFRLRIDIQDVVK